MIPVTEHLAIAEDEIVETFIRSSGPGGQNVNKVSSAVQIRFDVRRSPSLPEGVRVRLEKLAGARLTKDGVIVMTAERFRSQDRNRADAVERLVALIRKATEVPKPRRATKPTYGSQLDRLASKKRRATHKTMRGRPSTDD